jgi:hypothetical protein
MAGRPILLWLLQRSPQMGLDKLYVGDGMPLCADLPPRHFLKKGATYRLLGSSSNPRLLSEPDSWATNPGIQRLRLSSTSALYKKLCNSASPGGPCRYPSKMVLGAALPCTSVECDIESPQVLEVTPGLYYEYSRVPCVQQAFYSDGRALREKDSIGSCANPRVQTGAVACCSISANVADIVYQKFSGERLTYAAATLRCTANGLRICPRPNLSLCSTCQEVDPDVGYWTSKPCGLKIKIDLEGNVGIVHSLLDPFATIGNVHPWVREDTKTFFRVDWANSSSIDDVLADYATKCTQLGCARDFSDNLCLCPVNVVETQVFSGPPSRQDVLSGLYIGAFSPTYSTNLFATDLGGGVLMHSTSGQLSKDSIFEVVDDNGITQLRKNIKSDVVVGSNPSVELSFRNPSHFMSLTYPDLRDAQYETDAGLDHYFVSDFHDATRTRLLVFHSCIQSSSLQYHANTAPFLAMRFAQRFGISNPSPRYVDAIATAFRRGTYTDAATGTIFGSGKYGDLAALVAAVLLDREARSVVLDIDPAHGSMLEPFLKLVRVMRSLDFASDPDRPFVHFFVDLQNRIGQQPHTLPNVFSYFLPEYAPAGTELPLFVLMALMSWKKN